VARGAVADRRALLQAGRAGAPPELGAGEQQLLVEVAGSRDDHPRRADAPLHADLPVAGAERLAYGIRPVREPALDHRLARDDLRSLPFEDAAPVAVEEHPAEEGARVADDAVRRCQAAGDPPVEALRPETLLVALAPELLRALAPRVGPTVLARPLEHRPGGEHRPGRAPHQLGSGVAGVRDEVRMEVVGEAVVGRQPPRDGEDPRLAAEEARLRGRRQLDLRGKPRSLAPRLEGSLRCRREVERGLRVAPAPKCVQRPDDARSTDVEVRERQRHRPGVPVVGRPQRRRVVRRVAIRNDLGDAVADAPLVPRLVRERLERLGPVEHSYPGTVSTILPSCSPASSRSWAARASESGKTRSTTGLARPLRTSSYAPSKSAFVPIVEP
jgi:hypothetical protein